MTTIHPKGLAGMIARGEPFELVDIRPRDEFHQSHIRGAHSIPLQKLHWAGVTRDRGLMNPESLFLISRHSIQAGLAAGLLRGAGCLRPVVVDGGMDLWVAQGFPTVRPRHFDVSALMERINGFVHRRVVKLVTKCVKQLERVFLRPEKAWWCRYEFRPREAYRG